MIRVKICGITNTEDALLSASLGAWALGFVFYKKSPRYIAPLTAKRIIARLTHKVLPVGIFVNEKAATIKRIARMCKLKALQLHGDETPQFCRQFKGYYVIKAFRVNRGVNSRALARYPVDAFLFDTYQYHRYGGTGAAFNWKILSGLKAKKPIMLSGGINHRNINRALKIVKPYAVDVSSGVEKSPGVKDKRLLKQLFEAITHGVKK